jgi:hypothetical protein
VFYKDAEKPFPLLLGVCRRLGSLRNFYHGGTSLEWLNKFTSSTDVTGPQKICRLWFVNKKTSTCYVFDIVIIHPIKIWSVGIDFSALCVGGFRLKNHPKY